MKTNTMKTIAVAIITAGIVTVGQAALISENFEGYTIGNAPGGAWTVNQGTGSMLVQSGNGGKVLEAIGNTLQAPNMSQTFASQSGVILDFSFDANLGVSIADAQYLGVNLMSGATKVLSFDVGNNGNPTAAFNFYKANHGTYVTTFFGSASTWYTVTGTLNLSSGAFSFSFGGLQDANNAPATIVTGSIGTGQTVDGLKLEFVNPIGTKTVQIDNISLAAEVVPEPSTVLLFALGGGVVLAYRRRQRAM